MFLGEFERQETGSIPRYDEWGDFINGKGEELDGDPSSLGEYSGAGVCWVEKSELLLAWYVFVEPRISLWCFGARETLWAYHLFQIGAFGRLE